MATSDVELEWADGRYLFSLRVKGIIELQERCADPNPFDGSIRLSGPGEVAARLINGQWRINDVRETIRLGLIGGGMSPVQANTLCVRYVDERPLGESVLVARAIIARAMWGPPDEESDDAKKNTSETTDEKTSSSVSAQSTGSVLQ